MIASLTSNIIPTPTGKPEEQIKEIIRQINAAMHNLGQGLKTTAGEAGVAAEFSNDIQMNNHGIRGVSDPKSDQDVVNLRYLSNKIDQAIRDLKNAQQQTKQALNRVVGPLTFVNGAVPTVDVAGQFTEYGASSSTGITSVPTFRPSDGNVLKFYRESAITATSGTLSSGGGAVLSNADSSTIANTIARVVDIEKKLKIFGLLT